MNLQQKHFLILLFAAGCSEPQSILPWSVQQESNGVVFKLDAIRVDHSKPKVYPRCYGTCKTEYDGRFELTVYTDKPFGPVPAELPFERAPLVHWFGIGCQFMPEPEAGVTSIDFVCPFPMTNGWVAGREQRLGLGTAFPGLESPTGFEFEGATYDPDTFPSYTE